MLKILFGDINSGRLPRLTFLKYLLPILMLIALIMASLPFLFDMEHSGKVIKGGKVSPIISHFLSVWLLNVYLSIVLPPLIFTLFNLIAKRIRDTGFPGWWLLLITPILLTATFKIAGILAAEILIIGYILYIFFAPPNLYTPK